MKINRYPLPEEVTHNLRVLQSEADKKTYDKKLMDKVSPKLGSHERSLINSGQLKKVRHSKRMVFFEVDWIHQKNYIYYLETRFWYRTMTKAHFDYLVNNKMVNVEGEKDYGGIAPYFDYCAKPEYFGNKKSGTHIVEFELYCSGEAFCKEIQESNRASTGKKFVLRNPKAENGCVSIGLGPAGYYMGTAGKLFNEKLISGAITWRLVKFRVENPIPRDSLFYQEGIDDD